MLRRSRDPASVPAVTKHQPARPASPRAGWFALGAVCGQASDRLRRAALWMGSSSWLRLNRRSQGSIRRATVGGLVGRTAR
jgi:hypothetical protein